MAEPIGIVGKLFWPIHHHGGVSLGLYLMFVNTVSCQHSQLSATLLKKHLERYICSPLTQHTVVLWSDSMAMSAW